MIALASILCKSYGEVSLSCISQHRIMLQLVTKQALNLYGFMCMMLLKRNVQKSMVRKVIYLIHRDG